MSEIKPTDIEALLEIFESSDWGEMRLRIDGLDMFVSKTPGARAAEVPAMVTPVVTTPVPASTRAAGPGPDAARDRNAPDHWVTVRAPNLGTFYRSPKPGAPPYVEIGQRVDPGSSLCLIEVMKLFTTVPSRVSGTVREVLVADGQLVEFDQALFLIEPAS